MNYGRGFPIPQYGNQESWAAVNVAQPENGVGQSQSSWTAAMFGGQIPEAGEGLGEALRRVGPESWMTAPVTVRSSGNGIVGHRVHGNGNGNGNGFVQNDGIWNPVIQTNSYSRGNMNMHMNMNGNGNVNGSGSSSWTPVTPGKPNPQTTTIVTASKPRNQVENGNWEDLVGMYQDLLQKEPLNLNEVAQDHYQSNGMQPRVSTTPNKNFNLIQSSTHVPTTIHNPNANHGSNHGNQGRGSSTPNMNFNPILNSAHVPSTIHNPSLNPNHGSNHGNQSRVSSTPNTNFNPILSSTHVPSTIHNPDSNHGSIHGTQSRVSSTPSKNFYPILNSANVPSTIHNPNPNHGSNHENQSRVSGTPSKNFYPILNSTPVPSTVPNPNSNLGSSPPVSCFPSADPANWDYNLLAAIVRPKPSSKNLSDPLNKQPENNGVQDLNEAPAQNPFPQVGFMLQKQQAPSFIQKDGFPVPSRPCYDLNSPPRSELDAVSSRITGPFPFAPIES